MVRSKQGECYVSPFDCQGPWSRERRVRRIQILRILILQGAGRAPSRVRTTSMYQQSTERFLNNRAWSGLCVRRIGPVTVLRIHFQVVSVGMACGFRPHANRRAEKIEDHDSNPFHRRRSNAGRGDGVAGNRPQSLQPCAFLAVVHIQRLHVFKHRPSAKCSHF